MLKNQFSNNYCKIVKIEVGDILDAIQLNIKINGSVLK